MKVADMTTEQLKEKMKVIRERCDKNYTSPYDNKYFKGLFNEWERRVLARDIFEDYKKLIQNRNL